MKKLLFLLFFITSTCTFSQTISLDALRREYHQVYKDSAACAKLYKKITNSTGNDIITIAYRGAITAAMANHVKDKKEKLKLFNTGKKMLEQSIISDSSNIETRFLRFTVQINCPKALGYSKQIDSDKKFILKNYSSTSNVAVKKMIYISLTQTNFFTEAEKQKLN